MTEQIKQRKTEHVNISLQNDIAAPQAASWADIRLVHRALPEVDLDEIDLSTDFLGAQLRHPLWISSLTGGHPDVAAINERLGKVAEEYGLAMGVGSQRAALGAEALEETYRIARANAPTAFLVANIGAPQLIEQKGRAAFTAEQARAAVEMIGANALAIHLNYLQEASQPEGDGRAKGALAAVRQIAAEVGVPVIAKETGAGISYEQARDFKRAGVSAIDVGGAGGSSMAALESFRARSRGDTRAEGVGVVYRDWGIPDAALGRRGACRSAKVAADRHRRRTLRAGCGARAGPGRDARRHGLPLPEGGERGRGGAARLPRPIPHRTARRDAAHWRGKSHGHAPRPRRRDRRLARVARATGLRTGVA